jgi:hypothetical protein
MFLEKLKAFENQAIDDAVLNSELWWGKKKSRELVEDAFFPFLKYPKDEKKNPDLTKAPGMKPKMPIYGGEWKTRVFDVDYNTVFPNKETPDATPLDFVPKLSEVICGLKCNGIWIGGKGWGLTWQVEQIIVKPKIVNRVNNDICHLKLSNSDRAKLGTSKPVEEPVPIEEPVLEKPVLTRAVSVEVDDSDDEAVLVEEPATNEPVAVEEPAVEQEPVIVDEVVGEEPAPVPVPVVKKVIKKAVVPPKEEPVVEAVAAPAPTVVKKVIKKKV